jgi:hypothetical protein
MSNKIHFKKNVTYDWIRYKDGYWIPHRKRVYLYWFKYLQHAEKSSEYEVDWSKYEGWGGGNSILDLKFDEWWDGHWLELFGTKDRSEAPRFSISTKQPKTEALRLSLLCWERRNAPVWGRRGNALSIAKQVYEYELGISGEKQPRYGDDEFTAGSMNPETFSVYDGDNGYISDPQRLQSIVSRYIKNAKRYLRNVSVGKFP